MNEVTKRRLAKAVRATTSLAMVGLLVTPALTWRIASANEAAQTAPEPVTIEAQVTPDEDGAAVTLVGAFGEEDTATAENVTEDVQVEDQDVLVAYKVALKKAAAEDELQAKADTYADANEPTAEEAE